MILYHSYNLTVLIRYLLLIMKTTITFLMVLLFSITITAQDKIYVHTATVDNIVLHITYIDHPDLNGNPNAGLVFKHVWNQNGNGGVFNDNIDGLWYNSTEAKWAIFNEDNSIDMIVGAQFFIYIAEDETDVITHIADAAHQGTSSAYTEIDNAEFNGNDPGPYAVMSNYWNPNGVFNSFNYGFFYNDSTNKRNIYTESDATIPENAAFKVLIEGNGNVLTFHIATAANIVANRTVIDNTALNGNPDAAFVFSHYWGVDGAGTQVVLDAKLGAWYNGSNWTIFCEDTSKTIPEGMAFDIIIAPIEILGNDDFALETNFSMFPNPANKSTTITSNQEISTITIYNILGQEISTFKGEENNTQIDVSNLTTGNYLVKVLAENGNTDTLKLIKQ